MGTGLAKLYDDPTCSLVVKGKLGRLEEPGLFILEKGDFGWDVVRPQNLKNIIRW